MARKKKKSELFLKNPLDFTLLITVFILLGLGIVTVLSASSPTALAETGDSYSYVRNQIFFAVIGIAAMYGLSKVDYKVWQKQYKVIYAVCYALLLLVFAFGLSAGGATRWLNLGFISFQPSEVAKIGLIIYCSARLTKNKDKLKTISEGFIWPLVAFGAMAFVIVFGQNHLSATIVLGLLTVIIMILAGCRIRYFVMFALPIVIILALSIMNGGRI